MKIIAAPNAYKGSLTAVDAARAIASGVQHVFPDADVIQLPIADGGDGTLETLVAATAGKFVPVRVKGPLGDPIDSRFGLLPDGTAVIEMAEASGLRLLARDQLNPMQTTTFGTGQLIQAALDHGAKRIIIGVGGSATVDGGIGMAQALGATLLDAAGQHITYGGDGLSQLQQIDVTTLDPRIATTEFIIASDVTNPLTGPQGAAAVFGPQKGATPPMVTDLDAALGQYAQIIQRDLGKSVADLPGSGAAGGLAAGLVAFLDAKLHSGADAVLDALHADDYLQDADLVITGEGMIDAQTVFGKAPIGVARRARHYDVPVIAIAGHIAPDAEAVYEHGIDALVPLVDGPMTLDAAMTQAASLLEKATARALRLFRLGLKCARE